MAIIAILAAVAVPQFVGMINRAEDGRIISHMCELATETSASYLDVGNFRNAQCPSDDLEINALCGIIGEDLPAGRSIVSVVAPAPAYDTFCISVPLNIDTEGDGVVDYWCTDYTGFSGRLNDNVCEAPGDIACR